MSRIKSANTKPETIVRKKLFNYGFRYRLNGKCANKYYSNGRLPGKPDIVLAKYKTVIFVNGCFWHHHLNCKRATWPKTNQEYWIQKIKKNITRDKVNKKILKKLGWNVEIIWECEIDDKKLNKLISKLKILLI